MGNENRQTGCSSTCAPKTNKAALRFTGYMKTSLGSIPLVPTQLSRKDILGGWRVRWKIRRMNYRVNPGLYAVGNPGPDDAVLVTANYKLTFDRLRQQLKGRNAWILVLDTRGINVWCAAGKGLFSSAEIVRQLRITGLGQMVSHRTLLLPQLAGPGVSAHQVKSESGFRVVYGPVRAKDLPAFLDNRCQATPEMRTVNFTLTDRLVLIPGELLSAIKYFLIYAGLTTALHYAFGIGTDKQWLSTTLSVFGAMLMGTAVVPLLLPILPFRSFTLNGWSLGLFYAAIFSSFTDAALLPFLGNLLLLPAISALFALMFTGTSTYTSQTGVNREIRLFARPMAVSAVLGTAGILVSMFF